MRNLILKQLKTYVNVVVVKEGNEDNEGVKALVDVLKSDEIKRLHQREI